MENRYKILEEGKEDRVIVQWLDNTYTPYSVHTYGFNKDGLIWGHYFETLEGAEEYFVEQGYRK